MKEQATVSGIDARRQPRGQHGTRVTHSQDGFNERLDAVVQRFLERTSRPGSDEPASDDYAMRWAVAHYLRTQSRSIKGEHHVAA